MKLILPEIQELLQDEEVQVRNMAITVLVDICPLLTKGVFVWAVGGVYIFVQLCTELMSIL